MRYFVLAVLSVLLVTGIASSDFIPYRDWFMLISVSKMDDQATTGIFTRSHKDGTFEDEWNVALFQLVRLAHSPNQQEYFTTVVPPKNCRVNETDSIRVRFDKENPIKLVAIDLSPLGFAKNSISLGTVETLPSFHRKMKKADTMLVELPGCKVVEFSLDGFTEAYNALPPLATRRSRPPANR